MTSRKHNVKDKDNIPGSPEPLQKRSRHLSEGEMQNTKIFNDPIHGSIELHPLCVKIIDTPQFQRLRFLKQLGACYFVYPGATHNRFEHSIGVCHLAGRLVRALKHRQPSLQITYEDVLCVEIAGLCHDLGHGPFSHLFDGKFIPRVCPGEKWKHEDASRDMFQYMMEDQDLEYAFTQSGLDATDIIFIQEMVTGERVPGPDTVQKGSKASDWNYEGRSQQKSFLYEIVANKINGIDVDKWEYFARDCYMLGIKNNFDHNRCIHFARVLKVEGQLQICFRDKEEDNLYDMFHTRKTLHSRAYQHLVTNVIETMITDALVKANEHLKFAGKKGKLSMSEAIHDMKAYSQMTDYVFNQILDSGKPKLQESREILENIMTRKLYKSVGKTLLSSDQNISRGKTSTVEDGIYQKLAVDDQAVLKDQIVVIIVSLDYGMKDKNPIDRVRFYSKEKPNVALPAIKDQESKMKPQKFSEQKLCVFCKNRDSTYLDKVLKAFKVYCKDMNYPQPKGGPDVLSSAGTSDQPE